MTPKFIFTRLFAGAVLLCLVCAPVFGRDMGKVKEVSVEEANKLIQEKPANLVILDVRTPAEFREGHIAGAKNMDFFGGSFDIDVARLPKNGTILVYCRSGQRSAGAVEELQKAGFNNVVHMDHGLEAWEKAKLPVAK